MCMWVLVAYVDFLVECVLLVGSVYLLVDCLLAWERVSVTIGMCPFLVAYAYYLVECVLLV